MSRRLSPIADRSAFRTPGTGLTSSRPQDTQEQPPAAFLDREPRQSSAIPSIPSEAEDISPHRTSSGSPLPLGHLPAATASQSAAAPVPSSLQSTRAQKEARDRKRRRSVANTTRRTRESAAVVFQDGEQGNHEWAVPGGSITDAHSRNVVKRFIDRIPEGDDSGTHATLGDLDDLAVWVTDALEEVVEQLLGATGQTER